MVVLLWNCLGRQEGPSRAETRGSREKGERGVEEGAAGVVFGKTEEAARGQKDRN